MSANWPELSIDSLKAASKNAIAMGPFGSRIKAENFVKSGVPIIKGGNLNGDFLFEGKFDFLTEEKATELKASNAFRRDIVITHRGTIGQVGIIPDNSKYERYVASQSQLKVTLDQKKINPFFVYYFLRSPVGQHRLLANASQVGVPAIAQASTSVKAILVPYPDRDIQDRIVEMSLNLDHKIELNRQTNQTLEEMAQAVFKSWFVDFEPTRAKIKAVENGQDPTRAAMAAIAGKTTDQLDTLSADQIKTLTTTTDLFPDALVPSDLGEIPKGWIIEKLSDEIDILNGFAFKSKDYSVEGTFVLRTKNFNKKNGTDRLHDDVFLPEKFLISHKKYLSEAYDYHLIMVGASVGNRGIVYPCHLPALRNQNMWCFRAKESSIVTQPFAKYILDMLVGRSSGLASGSAREFFRKGDFGDQKICIGETHLQTVFFQYAMPLLDEMAALTDENQNLEALRDTLLPKLLSGEIDLSEAP